jgi:hypothetical protein
LYSERGDRERKKRKLQHGFYCRLYPFICWIIIKEGPGNFSGGRSPHWVNHVNLCLSCIVYLLCFVSAFFLFYCSTIHYIEFPHQMRKFLLNLAPGEPLALVQELPCFDDSIKMDPLLWSYLDLCVHDLITGCLLYAFGVDIYWFQLFFYVLGVQ